MSVKTVTGNTNENHFQIGIVAARWNSFVTDDLLAGALNTLKTKGFKDEQIIIARCPGAYEIPLTVQTLLPKVDGIAALGAVIRGETPHFDYVCETVNRGILQLNLKHNKPVTFGVLTTDTAEQAALRADAESSYGNKGSEAALALIEMLTVMKELKKGQVFGA